MRIGEQPSRGAEIQDILLERVADWELQFMLADRRNAEELADEALDELNYLWPYHDTYCAFGGEGVFPEQAEDGTYRVGKGDFHDQGISKGFVVEHFEQEDEYHLYHRFLVDTKFMMPHPVVSNTVELYAYMNMGASIIPCQELEIAVAPTLENPPTEINPSAYSERLDVESRNLSRMLGSVAFQQFGPSRQRRLVNRFVRRCEQEYDLRNLGVLLETNYCLRPQFKQGRVVEHEPVSLEDTLVSGIVLGYGAVERGEVWSTRGKKRYEIFNKETGLCLVVDVRQATDPTPLNPSDVIWIPMGNQELEVSYTGELQVPILISESTGHGDEDNPEGFVEV